MSEGGDERSGPRQPFGAGGLMDLARRAAVVWAVGIALVLLVLGAGYLIEVLLLAFAGLLLAVLLQQLSSLLGGYTRIGQRWALPIVVVVLLGLLVLGGWLLAPRVAEQVVQLREQIPQALQDVREKMQQSSRGRWVLEALPEREQIVSGGGNVLRRVGGVVWGTLGFLGYAVVVFFLGLVLAAQHDLYKRGILHLVPLGRRPRAEQVMDRIHSTLGWWLVGKIISMTIVGVLTGLGLWLLGVPLAITLAVLAALLTFIPNFGPILSAIPAVLMALLQSPMTAVWVVVLYTAIQTVESYLITPLIQQQAVRLPPALTITAQVALGMLAGLLGLVLATPLTAAGMVMVRMLYVEDALGDRKAAATGESPS